jgi:hypothetical protein
MNQQEQNSSAIGLDVVAKKPGSAYHLVDIPKGVFGEASKIFEEVEEFRDAVNQKTQCWNFVS